MVKKVLACLLLVVLWCSGAFGATELFTSHRSIVDLIDGKPDYSTARFLAFWVEVVDSAQATQEDVNLTGSVTFSGGSYSFWNGRNGGMLTNSETQRTFGLASVMSIGNELEYVPMTTSGDNIVFCLSADGGLNGVNVSWNFPDKPSYNGQGTIPNYRTTQEQLDSYVPYVEYISSGTQVTGLRWRVVNPDNTSEAVTLDFASIFIVDNIQDASGNTLYLGQWATIEAGNPASGMVTFDSPISEADISRIRVAFNYWNDASENSYQWFFCKPSTPEPYLWTNHLSRASLVNGKSDYSDARFHQLYIDLQTDNVIVEAKHLTEGRMTIPGGGYSLYDDDNGEELGVDVPSGTERSYKLALEDTYIGGTSFSYAPIDDDSGVGLAFCGGAETGLNGRTVTWAFPAEMNMDGSGVVPNFRSTAEQLNSFVPYVEIVSADGYITAVNYRLITPSNPTAAIAPSYPTDFRIYLDRKSGGNYRSSWLYNQSSGTWTLETHQSIDDIRRIRARVRCYDQDNPAVYQWNFYPAEAPKNNNQPDDKNGDKQDEEKDSQQSDEQDNRQDEEKGNQQSDEQDNQLGGIKVGGGTSGGCESGLALSGVILLALFLKKR